MENPTGTLDKFHLGVSADGQTCMMVFVDEEQRTIRCVADVSEFMDELRGLVGAKTVVEKKKKKK